MFNRLIKLPKNSSFFLFGARGTGKTFLLKEHFKPPKAAYFDLLSPEVNETFSLRPQALLEQLAVRGEDTEWIISGKSQ